jgi:hypothetical protein
MAQRGKRRSLSDCHSTREPKNGQQSLFGDALPGGVAAMQPQQSRHSIIDTLADAAMAVG